MIRAVKPSDFKAVYDIYMHERVIPYMGYDTMPIDAFTPIFNELVSSNSFLVFESQSCIKGLCRVNKNKGRSAHVVSLTTLAISPEEIGSGLAGNFIGQLLAKLQTEGILRVELMVEEDNPRARAFYEKLGFLYEGKMLSAYKRSSDDHYVNEIMLAKLF